MKKKEQQTANTDQNQKAKKKKPTLWIIIAVIAVIAIIGNMGDSNTIDTNQSSSSTSAVEAQSMTPEEIKDAAAENDLNIARPVMIAYRYYNNLNDKMAGLDTGETSLLDVYSYCEEMYDFLLDQYGTLNDMENDTEGEYTEYLEAAEGYVATAMFIPDKIIDYIDNDSMDSLQDAQENISLLPYAESEFNDAREAYLKAAGFTDEEIATRPSISE